ncbi:MAG: alpha-amylase family glycosyl hydrolase [Bryobacteraceae bacterium]
MRNLLMPKRSLLLFACIAALRSLAPAEINRLQLGARISSNRATFRVYSAHATRMELDVFRAPFNAAEVSRTLLDRDPTTSVWSVSIPLSEIRKELKITGIIYYGYRAWGPNWTYDPAWQKGSSAGFVADVDQDGNRFNPNKLLIDPYAHEISHDPVNPRNLDGTVYASGSENRLKDSGPVAPKGILLRELAAVPPGPASPFKDDIIYEVQLRGLTNADPAIPARLRGTFRGAAMKARKLKSLGVTAVEFLPVQETQNDSNDADPHHANYWGYATLDYFAPDRRYSSDKSPGGPSREFQNMVSAFHAAGLKVFIDVVYNHTGEGYAWHPADTGTYNLLSWRGLDNSTYYSLTADRQSSWDNTGVGGNYNAQNTVAQDLIVDSLAYWRQTLGVDGFRFDLASVLGNTCEHGCFNFNKLARQTALNRLAKEFSGIPLIAEPWAIGDGTYQLGNFPAAWSEWNGVFRDDVRRAQNKLGVSSVTTGELATRFAGSSDLLQNNGRKPWNSVNFIVAHDGFTLADLYRFESKNNNQPFPAGPSDGGTDNNESWDQNGNPVEQTKAARTGFALLMVSAGVPMVNGGDEFLRSLNGNNNPYNLDTSFNWLNYRLEADQSAFHEFAQRIIAFRRDHPALRPAEFYSPQQVLWLRPDGGTADAAYFNNPDDHAIAWLINGTSLGDPARAIYVAYNAWSGAVDFTLPPTHSWVRVADTSIGFGKTALSSPKYTLAARSLLLLVDE